VKFALEVADRVDGGDQVVAILTNILWDQLAARARGEALSEEELNAILAMLRAAAVKAIVR
jgi:hypothetical protein